MASRRGKRVRWADTQRPFPVYEVDPEPPRKYRSIIEQEMEADDRWLAEGFTEEDYERLRTYDDDDRYMEPYVQEIEQTPTLKWFDFTLGGFTVNFSIPTNAAITRWEWDCSRIPLDIGDNRRIGTIVTAKRFSVRVALWLEPSTAFPNGQNGDGFCGVEYRAFCFIDKTRQYNGNPLSLSGTNALGGFTNTNGGFLQANRMNSFYDMDSISNYRILIDTGLQHIIPKKSRINIPLGPNAGNPPANGTSFTIYSTLLNQPLISNTRTGDGSSDEMKANLNLNGTIDGAVELVAGTGGPIELGLVSALSDITFDSVNTTTGVSDFGTAVLVDKTDNNVNTRLEIWKPMPTPEYLQWDFPLDLDIYYPQTNLATPVYPIKNALRFGFIMYNTNFNVRVAIDTRMTYDDE